MIEKTLTDIQLGYLSACTIILDSRASKPDLTYWFCGEGDDEGESLCYDCIRGVPRVIEDKYGVDDICVSSYSESDSPEHCEECGKLLSYTLADYGVNSELEHFLDPASTWDWDSPDSCFELARVAHAASTIEQKRDLINVLRKGKHKPDFTETLK